MIKIVHITQQLTLGGAARSLIATAKYSSKLGNFRHSVISLLPAQSDALKLADDAGMTVFSVPDRNTTLSLIQNADIVHVSWWNNPEIYQFLHSDLPAMRLLIWFHVAGDNPPQIITSELVGFADFAVPCNPYSNALPVFQNLPKDIRLNQVGMIYDAADFARLSNLQHQTHNTFNVGYIGTVNFVKMHPNYVSMSAAIDIPNVRFIVCGSGIETFLQQQAQQLGAAERFDFRGYVKEIKPVIETLDVFGYPLCEDTYAAAELTLQEIMYAGIPPVVFPYGGVKQLVKHNETGMVVHSEKEYQEAIEYLYHYPEERTRIGHNASEYARRFFGAKNAAKSLNPIYERMMQSPKRKREWGIVPGLSMLDQAVRLSDLVGQLGNPTGSELFIESLGDTAQAFSTSKNSQDIHALFEAEKRIAYSSPVMHSSGIIPYRHYFPNDGYLRMWTGLVLQKSGMHEKAAIEFTEAIKLGCNHWRVLWYLAQSAEQMGNIDLVQDALRVILNEVPEFPEAKEMLHRVERQTPHSPLTQEGLPPLVSAIVSTYNSERFMHGCLEDLEAQTIADRLEIIVIDSNSPQNERTIVEEFQRRYNNIVYVRTEEREGVYAAWNRGIKMARGKYITNANTDDRHRPDAFERLVEILEARPEIALAYANVWITETENETFDNHTRVGGYRWRDFDPATMIDGCYMGPQPMWRKSLHKKYGYFDETFQSAGDWEFWLRLAATEQMLHVDEFLGLYLKSPTSVEHRDLSLSANEQRRVRQMYLPRFSHMKRVRDALAAGYAALEGHDLDTALAEFTAAAGQHPDMPEAHTALGQTLLVLGRPKEALKPLRRAIKLDSNQASAHNLLGKAQYQLDRHAKAKAAFKKAIAADPNNIEARLNLVDFHKSRNDLKQALAMARESLALGPQNVDVLTTCGLLMLDTDDLTGAEMAWQELPAAASVTHPGVKALMTGLIRRRSTIISPDTLLTAVDAAQQAADWPQAIALLKTLLGMTTGDDRATANLWNRLGYCYVQNEQPFEAEMAFARGLELAPENLDLLTNLADLYLRQERYEQASDYLNRALRVDPDDVPLLLSLGDCAIRLGALDTATMAFQRVQALAPETDGIDTVLQELAAVGQ